MKTLHPYPFALLLLLSACGGAWAGGIHARLAYSEAGGLRVVDVPEGPAEEAGLRPDDRVHSIDGEPVSSSSLEEVAERLRGPVGTRVRLEIERDGQVQVIEIERAPYRER